MSKGPAPYTSPPMNPPPSKASLKAWWKHFTTAQKIKKSVQVDKPPNVVFSVPLRDSLRVASVQISTANTNGELYVWGYIPVVVAKCGLYLKENGTEIEGTFRVSGSNRRMRDLQALFEAPPKYGKNLDWKQEHYTTHDVASVFRRYLTQMPEPVIPFNFYDKFREPLGSRRPTDELTKNYKNLIHALPRANQYLLLYVLDLLAVFARRSDKNLMTATNLAVIFRPGILSHPKHELLTREHQLSQDVLEFLIQHQDWFIFDIPPPPKSREDSLMPSLEPDEEDVMIVPSSDEEHRTEGGWKLVERGKRISRRRTLSDRGNGNIPQPGEIYQTEPTDLSPVTEVPSLLVAEQGRIGAVQIARSRTLPSRRTSKDSGGPTTDMRPQNNVLKKHKRMGSRSTTIGEDDGT